MGAGLNIIALQAHIVLSHNYPTHSKYYINVRADTKENTLDNQMERGGAWSTESLQLHRK
jgi:hypothetical protein